MFTSILESYIKDDSKQYFIIQQLGIYNYKLHAWNKAARYFSAVTENDENNYISPFMLALTYIEQGKVNNISFSMVEIAKRRIDNNVGYHESDKGEIYLAYLMLALETGVIDKVTMEDVNHVKATYGCSKSYLQLRDWRSNSLNVLDRHRNALGCP